MLIIVLVLSGYGYVHILSRRDLFVRKMKVEVHSASRTLKVSLERISLSQEKEYVQELIDAVEEYEKNLGRHCLSPWRESDPSLSLDCPFPPLGASFLFTRLKLIER